MRKRRLTITAFLLSVVVALGIGFAATTGSLATNGNITYHGDEAVKSLVRFGSPVDGAYSKITSTSNTEIIINSVFDNNSVFQENVVTDTVKISVYYGSTDINENATLPEIKVTPSVTYGTENAATDPHNHATVTVDDDSATDIIVAGNGSCIVYTIRIQFNRGDIADTHKGTYKITFNYTTETGV